MASRKIGPIYDALDAGNPKQAIKLCDGVLKKSGNIPIVKALKAVALVRTQKTDEALALARETSASMDSPMDEHVLNTLLITYRAAGKTDEMVSIYEAAHKAEPFSADLAGALFAAYLRASDFAKAQQIAMKLNKSQTPLVPGQQDGELIYWAVGCLLLQVDAMAPPRQPNRHYADEPAAAEAAKHLQLAAALLSRAAAQGQLRTAGHLHLNLQILRRQSAYSEACTLLASPHGAAALSNNAEEAHRLQAEMFERCGRLADAHASHVALLRGHSFEDWEALRGLVRCTLDAGRAAPQEAGAAAAAAAPLSVAASLEALSALEEEHPKARGARLARLYFLLHDVDEAAAREGLATSAHTTIAGARYSSEGGGGTPAAAALTASDSEALPPALAPLLEKLHAYFELFGEKTVCTIDVLPLLRAFRRSSAARAALLAPLDAKLPAASPPSPPELGWLRRFVTAAQWRVGAGATVGLSPDARMALARAWVAVYVSHRPLSEGLDARERGHADLLPLLAAQTLMGRPTVDWVGPTADGALAWPLPPLLAATLALRMALDASPHNFQLMLALMQCYLCLGAPGLAADLYQRLSIKYIQHDTLAYLVLPALDAAGGAGVAEAALESARRFQGNGLHELSENVNLAFRSGSYAQALEFVALQRALEGSWWRLLTSVLSGMAHLRAHAASGASFASSVAPCAFLTADLSAAALRAMPDTLDASVFEEHLPHDGVRRPAALRDTWLPRRAWLLRVLHHALRATPAKAPPDAAALAALEESVEALARLTQNDGGGSGGDAAEPMLVAEDWAAVVAMARLTSTLAAAQRDAPPEGPPSAADPAAVADSIRTVCKQVGDALELSGAAGGLAALVDASGFSPAVVGALTHAAQVMVPTLCLCAARWSALLGKPKKQGAGDAAAAPPKDVADVTDAMGVTSISDVRAVLREALEGVLAKADTLKSLLGASGRRSAACTHLEQGSDEWEAFLGGTAAGGAARKALLDDLNAASTTTLTALAAAVRNAAAALKVTAKAT